MNVKHTAVGIDFGSSRFAIAAVKRGGVEVLANEVTYRSTPSLMTFGDERKLGDEAKAKIKRNIKNSAFYASRYVGRKNAEEFQKEKKFNFSRLVHNEEGKVEFNVLFEGERQNFGAEQITASMFTKIMRILDMNKIANDDIVLSVPSFYNNSERQALLDAAKISGLNVVRLYNESTANVMNYGIFRKADLDVETERLVGFVDVGFSKTSIFFAKIYKNKAEIIAEVNDRHLGVRNIDQNMERFYCQEFQKKYGEDLRENPKSLYRLRESIEKQRKVLTGNKEASLYCECIFEDYDFSYTLTREDFEKINKNVFDQFGDLLKKALKEVGSLKKLHSIERIGGGSFIPAIEELVIKAFKLKHVNKTLDAYESIVRGCAIQAAMLSPNYNVSPYNIKERNYYPIDVELYYEGEEKSKKTSKLFKQGHELNTTLTISLKKKLPLYVQLIEKSEGMRTVVESRIEAMKPTHKNHEGKLWLAVNSNGMAEIKKAEMIEKFKVEEKIPKKKKEKKKDEKKNEEKKDEKKEEKESNEMEIEKDESKGMEIEEEEEIEYEIKKKEKTLITPLNYQATYSDVLNANKLAEFIKVEQDMCKKEQIIIETQKAKYILESYIYDIGNKVNESQNQMYVTPTEKNNILTVLKEGEEWLYADGVDCDKSTYENKFKNVSAVCVCFTRRLQNHEDIKSYYADAFPFFTNFEQNNNAVWGYATDLQLNDIKLKVSESLDCLVGFNDLMNNFDIKKMDKFDLEKKKTSLNANYKALGNIVTQMKKQKEEAEKKQREEEAKKKKEEEEAKKKAEEEQKQKDGETKEDNKEGEEMKIEE